MTYVNVMTSSRDVNRVLDTTDDVIAWRHVTDHESWCVMSHESWSVMIMSDVISEVSAKRDEQTDRQTFLFDMYGWTFNSNLFYPQIRMSQAFNSIQLLLLITEVVTLIWGSSLGCKVTCCAPKQHQVDIHHSVYCHRVIHWFIVMGRIDTHLCIVTGHLFIVMGHADLSYFDLVSWPLICWFVMSSLVSE